MRKTNSEFLVELNNINPNIRPLEPYSNNKTKILCRCNICGYEWRVTPHDLLGHHGCPNCAVRIKGEKRRKTEESFKTELSEKNPSIILQGSYVNTHTKTQFKCLDCNHIWETSPHVLLAGSGCPVCAKERQGRARITEMQFLNRLNQIHPEIRLTGKYEGYTTKTRFKCDICQYEWDDIPRMVLIHNGCPECVKERTASMRRKTHEQFCKELESINPEIEVLSHYTSANDKVLLSCKICGFSWEAKPNNLLNGSVCPKCAHAGTSYIEQLIYLSCAYLLGNDNVISRDRTLVGRELDIVIPKYKTAIEYGSWIWHKEHIEKDIQKYDACKSVGIRLIRIYDACKGDRSADGEDVFLFDFPISDKHCEEYSFICWLLDKCNFTGKIDRTSFIELQKTAYKQSRKKTTDSFKDELLVVNPNIVVIGEYQRDDIRIQVKCAVCGNEWLATPSNLLQGWGCPKCSKKYRRTKDEFLLELHQEHPSIELISDYINYTSYIECKCQKCGYKWETKPSWLLRQKYGCPNCGGTRRLTHEEFVERLFRINPDIQVVGEYKNYSTKIQCKCKKCGTIWAPTPHNILRGSGCPVCRRKTKKKNDHITCSD